MKTIVAGSRSIKRYLHVIDAVRTAPWKITEIVSGGAPGVDRLGERYAKEHEIKLTVMPADWEKYGRRAGHVRNREMAEYAEALVAVWDGVSRGTEGMIEDADKLGLRVHVVNVVPDSEDGKRRMGRKYDPLWREKARARNQVAQAVIAGKLRRRGCDVCGNTPTQCHHDDYFRPLDCRWLCKAHHYELHSQLRRAGNAS